MYECERDSLANPGHDLMRACLCAINRGFCAQGFGYIRYSMHPRPALENHNFSSQILLTLFYHCENLKTQIFGNLDSRIHTSENL
ncbi:hypothetical protein [Helicobacter sp. 23-1046]